MLQDSIIAGIDEAGRGAVAGPVVAGACVIPCELFRRRHSFPRWSPFKKKQTAEILIADSKLLSSDERETSFAWISSNCGFGVGIVSAFVIEKRGILYATNQAMLLALEDLRSKMHIDSLLIDGRDHFHFPLPHQSVIRGDMLHPEIAAGSIVAKVTRDRMMREASSQFPLYEFHRHKGYGTAEHMAAIQKHGPCEIHRRSFLQSIHTLQDAHSKAQQ